VEAEVVCRRVEADVTHQVEAEVVSRRAESLTPSPVVEVMQEEGGRRCQLPLCHQLSRREGGGARGAEGRRGGMGTSTARLTAIAEEKRMRERMNRKLHVWLRERRDP
jgi:hypothetical protein